MKRKAIVVLSWEEWMSLLKSVPDFIVREDQDWIYAVTGYEGAGKSLFVINTLYDLYKAKKWGCFDTSLIAFTSEEYIKIQNQVEKGRGIMWDEVGTQLFSREATKREVKQMVKIFITNRWRNLMHFLLIPSFKWLDIYMREMRVRTLVRVVYKIKGKEKEAWHLKAKDLLDLKGYKLERWAYIFTREDIDRLLSIPKWWRIMKSIRGIERFCPSFKVEIPDWNEYREGDERYWKLVEDYEEKKREYQEILDTDVVTQQLQHKASTIQRLYGFGGNVFRIAVNTASYWLAGENKLRILLFVNDLLDKIIKGKIIIQSLGDLKRIIGEMAREQKGEHVNVVNVGVQK